MNQCSYDASSPCSACGRIGCETCLVGFVLSDDGLGLDYQQPTADDLWWADYFAFQYKAAATSRRLREQMGQ